MQNIRILVLFCLTMTTCRLQAEPAVFLELFTSEGCSSCPPADRLLAKMISDTPGTIAIAYHVDYWNHLGWTDRFSRNEFSKRQERYAARLGSSSIYTPQLFINGRRDVVGSNEREIRKVMRDLRTIFPVTLHLKSRGVGQNVVVSYKLSSIPAGARMNVAIVQKMAETKVKSGENSGETLKHVNIVRSLWSGTPALAGSVTIASNVDPGEKWFVVGFLESDGILAAARDPG